MRRAANERRKPPAPPLDVQADDMSARETRRTVYPLTQGTFPVHGYTVARQATRYDVLPLRSARHPRPTHHAEERMQSQGRDGGRLRNPPTPTLPTGAVSPQVRG